MKSKSENKLLNISRTRCSGFLHVRNDHYDESSEVNYGACTIINGFMA